MSREPTLTQQTKKIFSETVDIYRNDFFNIIKNPVPIVILAAVMILFWLALGWV